MPSRRARTFKAALKLARRSRSPVSDQNLAKKRQKGEGLVKLLPLAKDVTVEPANEPGFEAEWITVPGLREDKVLVYLAGGGSIFRSNAHRDLISRVARASGLPALSVRYSLAPEYPFPAAVHETVAAYKWLLEQDFMPRDIVFVGDSSGGSIILSSLHQLREQGLPNPACVVVMSPATDGTLSSPSVVRNSSRDFLLTQASMLYFIHSYYQDTPRAHPIASPLFGSLQGLPPLLVQADRHEALYDDSSRLVTKAREAGVPVEFYETEGLWHVYQLFARYIPEGRAAINHVAEFIRKHVD
jgi:epsilon-lactone hydrolase